MGHKYFEKKIKTPIFPKFRNKTPLKIKPENDHFPGDYGMYPDS